MHVTPVEKKGRAQRILAGKCEGMRPLEKT